jgi:hypothetical protein
MGTPLGERWLRATSLEKGVKITATRTPADVLIFLGKEEQHAFLDQDKVTIGSEQDLSSNGVGISMQHGITHREMTYTCIRPYKSTLVFRILLGIRSLIST